MTPSVRRPRAISSWPRRKRRGLQALAGGRRVPVPGCGPARANDGTDNRTGPCGGWSPNATDPRPWWQVDFGAPYRIRAIELETRQNCCDEPETRRDFQILGSNDPAFGSYRVLAQAGELPVPFGGTWLALVNDPHPYRYLRAVKNGRFFITELRAYWIPKRAR